MPATFAPTTYTEVWDLAQRVAEEIAVEFHECDPKYYRNDQDDECGTRFTVHVKSLSGQSVEQIRRLYPYFESTISCGKKTNHSNGHNVIVRGMTRKNGVYTGEVLIQAGIHDYD